LVLSVEDAALDESVDNVISRTGVVGTTRRFPYCSINPEVRAVHATLNATGGERHKKPNYRRAAHYVRADRNHPAE
jgi:hypothetical protein